MKLQYDTQHVVKVVRYDEVQQQKIKIYKVVILNKCSNNNNPILKENNAE